MVRAFLDATKRPTSTGHPDDSLFVQPHFRPRYRCALFDVAERRGRVSLARLRAEMRTLREHDRQDAEGLAFGGLRERLLSGPVRLRRRRAARRSLIHLNVSRRDRLGEVVALAVRAQEIAQPSGLA